MFSELKVGECSVEIQTPHDTLVGNAAAEKMGFPKENRFARRETDSDPIDSGAGNVFSRGDYGDKCQI